MHIKPFFLNNQSLLRTSRSALLDLSNEINLPRIIPNSYYEINHGEKVNTESSFLLSHGSKNQIMSLKKKKKKLEKRNSFYFSSSTSLILYFLIIFSANSIELSENLDYSSDYINNERATQIQENTVIIHQRTPYMTDERVLLKKSVEMQDSEYSTNSIILCESADLSEEEDYKKTSGYYIIVAYLFFSLAAGAKEIIVRVKNKLEDNE